jgi:hypothetical protein
MSGGEEERRSKVAGRRSNFCQPSSKVQHPPTHERGDEAFVESGEVQFGFMFLGEQISGIVDSRMVLEIYFPKLDFFVHCVFSDIEVVKLFDRCGLGPIYATLVVIEDRSWRFCIIHFEVV